MSSMRSTGLSSPSVEFLPQRVLLLYRLSGSDVPAILMTSAIAAFALWGYISNSLLVSWLIWLVLASLLRLALNRAYRLRQPPPSLAARWENYFCIAGALLGTTWGITVMLLYPVRTQIYEVLVPFLIGSVAMGLPAALAPSPKSFACLIIPILAPQIGLLFSLGGAYNASAAILMLVFTTALLVLYLSSHRALIETLRFGRENEELLQQVKQAKERLDISLQASDLLIWEWDARRGTFHLDGSWGGKIIGERGSSGVSVPGFESLVNRLHPEDAPHMKRAIVDCLKGVTSEYTAEHRVRMPGGEWKWSSSRGRVVERDADGRAVRMTGINVDIDRQKRAEAELLAAVQREKELTEMKSKFVSMASHEFRTPLATILSSAELLDHYADKLDAGERANLLQSIQNGSKRMGEMIDDVLMLGRAESGVLHLNPARLDLRELCRKVVAEFRIAQGKQHVVEFQDSFDRGEAVVDERLLRHILNNLLSNAAKYSPAGSEVTLSLSRRDEQVLLEVQDRGIGIPEQDRARLFESFHRASNVEGRPGTGLGLAIVKKAVELHGGEIGFTTELGAGTRFTVTLPLQCKHAAETG